MTKPRRSGRARDFIRRWWPTALTIIGLVILAIPVATDMYESWQAQTSIATIESEYDVMGQKEIDELFQEAEAYDHDLLEGRHHEGKRYPEQLAWGSSDMMAHLSIPKLSLELPIYHGTDENTLMIGVGHLEGTTLPVGTTGGRCVLAAHSGLPHTRMFDDIQALVKGDRFVVWTLGRPMAYQVIESKVVTPDKSEELLPEDGRDLVTLVTCVPYNVNTHRLLVTGERCEYVSGEEDVPEVEAYVNRRTIPLLIGMAIVLVAGIVTRVIVATHRRRRTTRDNT